MIRSMTGWGEAERVTPAGRLRVEIRTVNHRHFNASLRTPHGFDRLEADIQSWIRPRIARGHVSYQLFVEHGGERGAAALPALDLDRALHYRDLIRRLRQELGLAGDVDVGDVVRLGGVFRAPAAVDVDPEAVRGVTEEAVHSLVATRESEGSRLAEDLLERLGAIEQGLERVRERAPARLAAERDRLRAAVRELTAEESTDEERLAREIAYLAEKWDINEELVRFRAHVEHFRETLAAPRYEPVGKRLGFLVQEMQREANTIGAKANDLAIARAAMAIKEEIERLREQLENVE
ncbi:MAG: YicC family protein [Gemmatimonadota bacterium]|nr:YicC family protein [Gemmatimonadota bacterium]